MNEFEIKAANVLSNIQVNALLAGTDVNLVTLIAKSCGWLPLEPKEKMVVHYGGNEYEIIRRK